MSRTDTRTIIITSLAVVLVSAFSLVAAPMAGVANLVRLKIAGTAGADETVVYFDPDATDDFDGNFDALKMYAGTPGLPNISSRTGNTEFAINVLGEFNHDRAVPLSVYITQAGSYTISALEVIEFDPTAMIVLEDRITGQTYNLRTNQNLQFHFTSGFYANRFVLHFHVPVKVNETGESCNLGGGRIQLVNPSSSPWNARLYSAEGQPLSGNVALSDQQVFPNLAAGSYTVKLTKEPGYSVTIPATVLPALPVISDFHAPPGPVKLNYPTPFTSTQPTNGSSFTWNFGDGSPEVSGPEVIHAFTHAGVYPVRLTVSNSSCSHTSEQTFTILHPEEPQGIEDQSQSLHAILYPNPASDIITVRINLTATQTLEWAEIQDLSGRTISREYVNGMLLESKLSIPVTHLNNGTYRLILSTQKERIGRGFTIAR